MTDTLFTIQEYNEYNAYDKLYPKTLASLIVNPPQATGARIDVLAPLASGRTVYLKNNATSIVVRQQFDTNGKTTFDNIAWGSYTIWSTTTSGTITTTVEIDAAKIYDVGLGVSTTLNDNDWATISAVSKAGLASTYWSVGDTKNIVLNGTVGTLTLTGYNISVFILDFNHDKSSVDGVKDGITFGCFANAISDFTDVTLIDSYRGQISSNLSAFTINYNRSNAGGWKKANIRYNVLGTTDTQNGDATPATLTSPFTNTLMSCLSNDLRAVMRPMCIYTDNTGGGSDTASYVTSTLDYLPLLSEFEVYGVRTYANSAEQDNQSQYAYYKNGKSRIKYEYNSPSTAAIWWLRTPVSSSTYNFLGVDANTSAQIAGSYYANYSFGIAPMFKV